MLATRASPTASEAVLGGRPLGRITPTLSVGATAALLAVTLRVPFWGAPLTADEGGYAEAARLWSRGWHLYTDVWVDRPQGLVLGFRAIRWLGLTSPQEFRVAAATIGLLVLGATALVAYRLAGRQVAIVAALLLAVAGSSPYIESFTLSGELLALVPTLLALRPGGQAVGSRGRPRRSRLPRVDGAAPLRPECSAPRYLRPPPRSPCLPCSAWPAGDVLRCLPDSGSRRRCSRWSAAATSTPITFSNSRPRFAS